MNVKHLKMFLDVVPDKARVFVASEDTGDCLFAVKRAFLFNSNGKPEVWLTIEDEQREEEDEEEGAVIDVDFTEVEEQANMKKYGSEV